LQECLANTAKHAQASRVRVALYVGAEAVNLTVKDDGRGFSTNVAAPGHYGLRNMLERAQSVGAHLDIESKEGEGTQVVFTMPTKPNQRGSGKGQWQ
jgi:signal transduction histidine kinase